MVGASSLPLKDEDLLTVTGQAGTALQVPLGSSWTRQRQCPQQRVLDSSAETA